MNRLDRGLSHTERSGRRNDRLLRTFLDLVRIDSPTGSEEQMSSYLLKHFQERELFVEQDNKLNVFARVPSIGESLLLAAHMDTVEPGRGISPRVSRGIVRSDGTTILGADNKSTLAVILETVDVLVEQQVAHRPLELLFTVDEEGTTSGAAEFDYSKLHAKNGLIADIAEPLGTLVLASPAYIQFNARFIGKSGHAAYPDKAKNVNRAIAEALRIPQGYLDDLTTLNIGRIEAGSARNSIPGEGIIRGEIRGYDEHLLRQHVQAALKKLYQAARTGGVKLELTHSQDNPGYIFEQNDPYVQEIATLLSTLGFAPRFVKSPSVSDANIYNSKGLQVINIGDGTRRTHTTEESIRVSDMVKLVTIFYSFALHGVDKL